MQIAEVYIAHILDSGCGFASRTDDGSQCFLPASVVKKGAVSEGDIATAKLIPNTHPNNASTPWVGVHVAKKSQVAATEFTRAVRTVDDEVYELVCDRGYATTKEIASDMDSDVSSVHNALLRLFNKGRVAKAEVHARPDQGRASFCMWATDVTHFLGENSDES